MKKFILGLTIGILLAMPLFVFSASNLADKLKGKILLAVEDKGKTYYVHEDGNRYRITSATAHKIFEKLALGITNKDLKKITLKDVGINPENSENSNELKQCILDKDMWHTAYNEWHNAYQQLENTAEQHKTNVDKCLVIAEKWKENSESWRKSSEDWEALAIKGGDRYIECVAIAEEWKNEYLSLYKGYYALNSTAVIECYNDGYLISCYDITLFPTELIQKLKSIENETISTTQIERKKAKAIEDYYSY